MPVVIRQKRALKQDVLTLGRERVIRAFEMYDHIAISFSGGKDSTVCLNLALEEARRLRRLPLDVVFLDEEAIPYQTEEYVRRVAQIPDIAVRWFCVPVSHRNSCSADAPWWYPWDPDLGPERWVRPMPPEAITSLEGFTKGMKWPDMPGLLWPHINGSIGMIMGIRAQESLTRHRAVTQKAGINWIVPYAPSRLSGTHKGIGRRRGRNLWKVYPIYDWKTEDVWTAPDRLGWDYNRAYDVMAMAGIRPPQQRCAPPFGDEPMQNLWMFKTCFPELWERMHNRVPGAATAARYARTSLYAYGDQPEKPADMTWPEYIRGVIAEKPDEKVRKLIAWRLRKNIRTHYGHTSDPILEVRHPITGISWPFLASVALRGDLFERRQALAGVTPANRSKLRADYQEALARWRAESGGAAFAKETI